MPEGELTFQPLCARDLRTVLSVLERSYAALPGSNRLAVEWRRSWGEAMENPAIADCCFITCLDGRPIGLASYDPRPGPQVGIVGQNCIVPEFQGRGFGRRQMEEVLHRLRARGIRRATVTTSGHAFFESARRMYEACGFRPSGTPITTSDDSFGSRIELERDLQ